MPVREVLLIMFKPAALFIGFRYTRAKSRHQFISLISFVSVAGIALGVTVLITVLSVINGFDREIKKQVFGMISPITISSYTGRLNGWKDMENQLRKDRLAAAPFASGQAMLTFSNMTLPVMLAGVLPAKEIGVSALPDKMIKGRLSDLKAGHYGIVLGVDLAGKLGVTTGDEIIVATLKDTSSTTVITPHFKKFIVTGIFQAGGGGLAFDSKMAFIHLNDAQSFFSLGNAVTGLHVNIEDLYQAPRIASLLQSRLTPDVRAWDWTEQLGGFFENIRVTKTMMFFIFVLIIAVAAFNLICTMIMIVKNKQADIAILRTLGATPLMILTIFVIQGICIALGGTLLGIIGGITLASNVSAISTWVQQALHMQLVSSQVYFVNYLPSELHWPDVWLISLVALALSLAATLYPAWNAARIDPVEALNAE
ncbi:Lipoprotein-releasing system transmembrane protein LolE [Aquicella siphonis]|uniref:Lipoprotein-releasing system transmembrane protein LolE n=1 Tax=Aquicella siphonis TaxID=254247 RepID=A0A5E4PEW6_9COXI|nr:lipoprotein-releasing ABC transporter permease subunit [Aquicella siphonis]VVC74967.1 Lipoprotein-releasing system transmembrane protein LolE [Aquicella siphonis]